MYIKLYVLRGGGGWKTGPGSIGKFLARNLLIKYCFTNLIVYYLVLSASFSSSQAVITDIVYMSPVFQLQKYMILGNC